MRILDFGLAKLRDGAGSDVSLSQMAVGTPSYMSPEQARGSKVDARSDVYSAGVLVFELLAGRKPFVADEAYALLDMHRETAPPRLAEAAPERSFSPELEAAIARALAKSADDRFQTAAAFMEALGAAPEAGRVTTVPPELGRAATEAMPSQPPVPAAPAAQGAELPPPPPEASDSLVVPRRGGGRLAPLGLLLVVLGGLAYWRYRRSQAADTRPPHAAARHAAAAPDAGPPAHGPGPTQPASAGMSEAPVAGPDAAPAVHVAAAPAAPDAAPPPADAGAGAADAEPEVARLSPEEQAEPVAPVPEQAKVEESKVDAPEEQPRPEPGARPVTSVADAQALIVAGKKLEAIVGLQRLRRQNPKSAYIPYLLGNLYFERLWFTQGLEAYGGAVANDHSYRGRATLSRNAIRALGAGKTHAKAYALLKNVVGRSALPYLRRAAAADPSGDVRARAAALVRALDPPRKPPKKHRSGRSRGTALADARKGTLAGRSSRGRTRPSGSRTPAG